MPKPIALITEPIAQAPKSWLADRCQVIEANTTDHDTLIKLIALYQPQALVVRTYTIVNQQLIDNAPSLKVIARAGVGLDNIDLKACQDHNIPVVHTPAANTQAVVEYVTSLMLSTIRPLLRCNEPLSDSDWHTLRDQAITPRSIVGAQLGILGLGKIGSALAIVAKALGMDVVFYDIKQDINQSSELNHHSPARRVTLDELASTSDILSIHVDGRSSNNQIFSHPFFNQLKHNAILINTSRGFVIDNNAATNFANQNPDSTLIFDVHDPEPIAQDSPLNNIANIIRTPHIAAGTKSAKERMSWVVKDVVRILEGQPPEYPANITN